MTAGELLYLYRHASDSLEAQDLYYKALGRLGVMDESRAEFFSDEAARRVLKDTMESTVMTAQEKDFILHVLDVKIQNQGTGLGSPVISEILACQFDLIREAK